MDKYDLKILKELEFNCRRPISHISSSVGLSNTAVIERIKNLEELKIVSGYIALTDANKLGNNIYTVCFTLHDASEELRDNIISFLKEHKDVGWCCSVFGRWEILCAVITKDPQILQDFLNLFETQYNGVIKEKHILINLETYSFPCKYLYEDQPLFFDNYVSNVTLPNCCTPNEMKVLNYLKKHPKAHVLHIAENVNLSRDTVMRAMKSLQDKGVILRYKAHVNVQVMGFQWHILLVSTKNFDSSLRSRFVQFISSHPHFVYLVETIGGWQYTLSLHSRCSREFKENYEQFRREFDGHIKHIEILQVADRQKHLFIPMEFD